MTPAELAARLVKQLRWYADPSKITPHNVLADTLFGRYTFSTSPWNNGKFPMFPPGGESQWLDTPEAAQAAAEADYRARILAALDLAPLVALVGAATKAEFVVATHETEQGFKTQIGDELRTALSALKETPNG
jgi:hypothetical protein